MSRPSRQAIVIGGSIAGLAAALMFRRKGWSVKLYERGFVDQRTRGAGIVTHPQLHAALATLGVAQSAVSGPTFTRRIMLDREGHITHELRYPQMGTAWAAVYAALVTSYGEHEVRAGYEFVGCEERSGSVTVRFGDGSEETCDVLVGADGIRSSVRRSIFPEIAPLYAGYITWRGVVPAQALADRHRMVFEDFCFGLPAGEQFASYPMGHPDDVLRRSCNFVWYRPAGPEALRDFLTDDSGTLHPLGIPPPLVRRAHVERMRRDASALLAPQFGSMISSVECPFLQPIYDLESPAMHAGRVALIGDAAFVARPHVGAGVTKALEDAIALVGCLDAEAFIEQGLARFAARRGPMGRTLVARGRELGVYMQAGTPDGNEQPTAPAAAPDAASFLSEHASLDFLM